MSRDIKMKGVRIAYNRFWFKDADHARHHWLTRALEVRVPVEVVSPTEEHDVLLQFAATDGHSGHPPMDAQVPGNPLRVWFTCEPLAPDYARNHVAISYDRVESDTHYRMPNYVHIFEPADLGGAHEWRREWSEQPPKVTMMARNTAAPRLEFARFLETKGALICAGTAFKDFDGWLGCPPASSLVAKTGFLRRAPFHAAFENSTRRGFITEKVPHAFAAGVIPVWWGAEDIAEDFNPAWMIQAQSFRTFEELWDHLVEVHRQAVLPREGTWIPSEESLRVWDKHRYADWLLAAVERHRA